MSLVAYTGIGGGSDALALGAGTVSVAKNKVFRNSVFFRFASEGSVLEKVEFIGKEIAVGDLKQAIADVKKLERLDLQLVNEATGEVYEKDGKILPRNMTVTVRRTPQIKKKREPRVLHVEPTDCWEKQEAKSDVLALASAPKVSIQRRACPQEFICKVCGNLFDDPHIARCCGYSACGRCVATAVGSGCTLCGRALTADLLPVPNVRLRECIASLDLDYFILPNSGEEQAASTPSQPPRTSLPVAGAVPATALAAASSADAGAAAPVPAAAPALCDQPWAGAGAAARPPPPVPAAVDVRPCMLSPAQFMAWQQSVRGGPSDSDSSSSGERRKRKRKEKAKDKGKKRKKGSR